MPKQKNKLSLKVIKFDVPELALRLAITEDVVKSTFKDGRTASRFTELWSARLYDFEVHKNPCVKDSDGIIECQGDFNFNLSVKTLTTHGVKFQLSRFVGKGRKCGITELEYSLDQCDRVCVCDIRNFPFVSMTMIDSKLPLKWVREGRLKPAGLNASKYYSFLKEEFDISKEMYVYDEETKVFVPITEDLSAVAKEVDGEDSLFYEDMDNLFA